MRVPISLPRAIVLRHALVALVCAALATISLVSVAYASEQTPSVEEVSREVVCPTCDTMVDQSDSPAADRMRAYIAAGVEQGWTKQQILDGLVREYGGDTSILARPPASGLSGLAWWVPAMFTLGALVLGASLVMRWRRRSDTPVDHN